MYRKFLLIVSTSLATEESQSTDIKFLLFGENHDIEEPRNRLREYCAQNDCLFLREADGTEGVEDLEDLNYHLLMYCLRLLTFCEIAHFEDAPIDLFQINFYGIFMNLQSQSSNEITDLFSDEFGELYENTMMGNIRWTRDHEAILILFKIISGLLDILKHDFVWEKHATEVQRFQNRHMTAEDMLDLLDNHVRSELFAHVAVKRAIESNKRVVVMVIGGAHNPYVKEYLRSLNYTNIETILYGETDWEEQFENFLAEGDDDFQSINSEE